jgi:hypothetical protein
MRARSRNTTTSTGGSSSTSGATTGHSKVFDNNKRK